MRLLPTSTDVILTISNLPTDTVVRVYNQSRGTAEEMSPAQTVNYLNCHTTEIVCIDQKCIVLKGLSGTKYTVTFHKRILTQIGIEAL